MKAVPTRTLNPLPFQDLEPHRFEDLVRQLAYDLRSWKSIEATGRGGSDEGLDIRAIEVVTFDRQIEEDEEGEAVLEERTWVFQCKREKALPPSRLCGVVEESLSSLPRPPYGFVLAVACDVSKRARDEFRAEMFARGIEEFSIWAKGELEDMLFQPRNDHLLFAYFGLSLQHRRRSQASSIRSLIARKKQLKDLMGDDEEEEGLLVLLRDPADDRYPGPVVEGERAERWLARRAVSWRKPGCLVVRHHEYLAATTPDGLQWDALFDLDLCEIDAETELRFKNAWEPEEPGRPFEQVAYTLWNDIPEPERVHLKVYRFVPLERIVAIDPLGDGPYPVPHIFVDCNGEAGGPFTPEVFSVFEQRGDRLALSAEESNRAQIFPRPLARADGPPAEIADRSSESGLPFGGSPEGELEVSPRRR